MILTLFHLCIDASILLQANVNIESVFTELTTQILSKGSYMVKADPLKVEDSLFGQQKRDDKCGVGCANR